LQLLQSHSHLVAETAQLKIQDVIQLSVKALVVHVSATLVHVVKILALAARKLVTLQLLKK
jgi:hypothetical protein